METAGQYCFQLTSPKLRFSHIYWIQFLFRMMSFQCQESTYQRAKKVVSDSLGLGDFAIRLVFFVLNLPDREVLFFGEIQITEGLLSILPIKKSFGAS